jgi:peptidoglycan/LPS O-acetylase OafA/YrhL
VRPLAKIGYYPYSIYLWHGFVCRLLPLRTLPGVLACFTVAVLGGIGMAKLVEYPVLAVRDRMLPSAAQVHEPPRILASS